MAAVVSAAAELNTVTEADVLLALAALAYVLCSERFFVSIPTLRERMSTANHNNSSKTQNSITAYFARHLHEPLDYLFAKDFINIKEYSASKRLCYLHHLNLTISKQKLATPARPKEY